AMHAERADEISLKQPERFSEQQCIRHFRRHAVNDFTPKLFGYRRIELSSGHAVLRPGWNRAAGTRFGEPKTLNMFLGESHRRIKADDREISRHMQDGLNDGFAYFSLGIIKLRCVIPWEGGAIVTVIDIADIARLM